MGLPRKPRRCNSLCTRVRDTTKRRKMGSQRCFPSTFACDNTRTLSVAQVSNFRKLLWLLSCLAPIGGAPVGARVCVRQGPGQLRKMKNYYRTSETVYLTSLSGKWCPGASQIHCFQPCAIVFQFTPENPICPGPRNRPYGRWRGQTSCPEECIRCP